MRVTDDKIAVTPCDDSVTTIGGIVIPENTHRAIRKGIVKTVGPSENPRIIVGDVVYYQAAAAVELEVNGETLAVLHQQDVLVYEER